MEKKEVKARLFEICEEKKKLEFEIDFFVAKVQEISQKLSETSPEELLELSQMLSSFSQNLQKLSQKYQDLEKEEEILRGYLK